MRSLPRLLAGVTAALGLTAATLVVTVAPASACVVDDDGDCYHSVTGTVTATAGLNVRSAPWGTVIDTVPYNYSNSVDCYVQASDGSYWDWLYDTRIGRSAWVYDQYLYTGGNIYQQVDEMHEGNCGSIPLTIPGSVHATAISTGSIRVTWTDTNSATANYVVSNGNVSSADLPVGSTSYTWSGLAPGTYMCFTVTAKKSGQQSPWSPYSCTTSWSLTTPTNVRATATSGSTVLVQWSDPSGGAAQFVVNGNGTLSPTLAAGTTSYTVTGITAGTLSACFSVAAKQSGQQSPWSASVCVHTPSYFNLGDSFSAGEGTYAPYETGSDTGGNECHRSLNSYAAQFATHSTHWNAVVNVACSGAVTYDISNAAGSPNHMGIPADGEQAQTTLLDGYTGLITLTIGGNNLNLGGKVTDCVKLADKVQTNNCFLNTFSQAFIDSIGSQLGTDGAYGPSLVNTFNAIKTAAPHARIVVSTYPQIFPATFTGTYEESLCSYPIANIYVISSAEQLKAMRDTTHALNLAIKAAASQAKIEVRDEENLFSGHEIGTTLQPYVNQINGLLVDCSTQTILHDADDESLHPTAAGYQKWGADLLSYLG